MRILVSAVVLLTSCASVSAQESELADPAEPVVEAPAVLNPEEVIEGCLYQAEMGTGSPAGCIGVMVDHCPENLGTTVDMLNCLSTEIDFWEQRLVARYKTLKTLYLEQDSDFDEIRALGPQLENVQAAWADWRDAKCGFAYSQYRGGSLGRIVGADCRLEETARRVIELEELIAEAQM